MADFQIPDKTLLTAVDRAVDSWLIYDNSATALKRTTAKYALDLTSHPVGVDDTQTLTAKTLTSPTINGATLSGTLAGTYTIGGTPTFPSSVVTLTGSQTLTNKVLTSPTINSATITNPTLAVDTVSEHTSANGVTIDSLNIKDGKLNTNDSVVTANITNSAVTTAKIADASVTNAKLSTAAGEINAASTAWTPTITAATGSFTTVSGAGKYHKIGKRIFFEANITITTVGTGQGCVFTVPVTASASGYYSCSGRDDAVSGKMLQGRLTSTTQIGLSNYDNTNPSASGAIFRVAGNYEMAA